MPEDIARQIKSMKIRGARVIALASLRHLRKFGENKGFGPSFRREAGRLLAARPTAVPLHNVIRELEKKPSLAKTDLLIRRLERAPEIIAEKGKSVLKQHSVVMTHCHSTEDMIFFSRNRKRISRVFVTETRPRNQGVISATALRKARVPVSFIVDSASGFYMPEVDAVVVGADALRKEGLVNKIGTLPLAITAKAFGKPFYVIADTFKLDRRSKIEIEMRPESEVHAPIKGVKILNPAFDITPWKYVSKIVTEEGVFAPSKIIRILRGSSR